MDFAELWSGGPKYGNGRRAFPLMADSILLADFAASDTARSVLDIGCGSGIIGLLIAWNNSAAHVTGIDISQDAVMCTRENIAANSLDGRFDVRCGDIKDIELTDGSFDLVVCNPPYFKKGREKSGEQKQRSCTAREESTATLRDIVERASTLLRPGGAFCLVLLPERLGEALEAMTELEFSPARLRMVMHTETAAPSMALIEAWLGATAELEVLPPLILKDGSGAANSKDSEEIRRIYHMD